MLALLLVNISSKLKKARINVFTAYGIAKMHKSLGKCSKYDGGEERYQLIVGNLPQRLPFKFPFPFHLHLNLH